MVKLLLSAGADIHYIQNDGHDALTHAFRSRHEKTIKYLINQGADTLGWAIHRIKSSAFHIRTENMPMIAEEMIRACEKYNYEIVQTELFRNLQLHQSHLASAIIKCKEMKETLLFV